MTLQNFKFMINVAEKLKDCPKGTKLYSPLFGEVEFVRIDMGNHRFSIIVKVSEDGTPYSVVTFTDEGKWYNVEQSECLLFPSKDNRDWNKFNLPVNTLKPFDKVLVRDSIDEKWTISLFSYYDEENQDFPYVCISGRYVRCIPYEGNEHLLGTPSTPKDY